MDAYVARFDSSGTHVWSKAFGGVAATSNATGVATDPSGDVLVGGFYSGTVDFGGGPLAAGATDVFVVKLTGVGSHAWSKQFGDVSSQLLFDIASDSASNVIITGSMMGSADFGGGVLTSAGSNDIFLAKLDSSGTHVWSDIYGDASNQNAVGVETDASGNVLATGSFTGDVDFGGGTLSSLGSNDAYVAKFTSGGVHVSSQAFGDVTSQTAARIVADPAGNRYVTGGFNGTVDFGNGALMSSGDFDAFIVKLAP